jgi:hypothetical protein
MKRFLFIVYRDDNRQVRLTESIMILPPTSSVLLLFF